MLGRRRPPTCLQRRKSVKTDQKERRALERLRRRRAGVETRDRLVETRLIGELHGLEIGASAPAGMAAREHISEREERQDRRGAQEDEIGRRCCDPVVSAT